MKKFLDYINIPKNIKRYFILKKMDNMSENNKNSVGVIIVDLLIFIALAATFIYIFFISKEDTLKIFGIISIVLFLAFLLVKISVFVMKHEKRSSGIEKLILIDEEGVSLKSWDVGGRISLVIGKSSADSEVDIDLKDTDYSSLVSRQHAVLNFANDSWFIEDIGSVNGSGIKRADESSKFKIEKGTPYKINSGDIIYIANSKLLTK